jgi:fatty acid amide hydrolase
MPRKDIHSPRDTIHLSASELARAVKTGDLSAVEIVDAHIDRIEQVNPALNAVVIPMFDEARAQAKAADKMRARGEPLGRLHGVPVTVKEQYKVRGTQTTLGATNKIGNVYDDEGPLVTKLRAEGAIILGKTNIIQTLLAYESDNRVYGRTNNPWDLERSPGGSSGGDAAIVAAGGAPLALAGDLGGSVRIPPHSCGVHGFKPTMGG